MDIRLSQKRFLEQDLAHKTPSKMSRVDGPASELPYDPIASSDERDENDCTAQTSVLGNAGGRRKGGGESGDLDDDDFVSTKQRAPKPGTPPRLSQPIATSRSPSSSPLVPASEQGPQRVPALSPATTPLLGLSASMVRSSLASPAKSSSAPHTNPASRSPSRGIQLQDQYCPCCQCPFDSSLDNALTRHVAECIDSPRPTEECRFGIECFRRNVQHFSLFKHDTLAARRSQIQAPRPLLTKGDTRLLGSPELGALASRPPLAGFSCSSPPQLPREPTADAKSGSNLDACLSARSSSPLRWVEEMIEIGDDILESAQAKQPSPDGSSEGPARLPAQSFEFYIKIDSDDSDDESGHSIGLSRKSTEAASTGPALYPAFSSAEDTLLFQDDGGMDDELFSRAVDQAERMLAAGPPRTPPEASPSLLSSSLLRKTYGLVQKSISSFFKPLWSVSSVSGAEAERSPSKGQTVAIAATPATPATPSAVKQTSHGSFPRRQQHPKHTYECPFYKKLPGTPFTVDAFKYGAIPGCKAYFLSHFHSDHYGGLKKSWSHGPIYCGQVTANLVHHVLRVPERYLVRLDMNVPAVVEGIEVVALDANHCPGSCLFKFTLPDGRVYLHTGDFRADPSMLASASLAQCKVSCLYLDTTYCSPRYCFPPQSDVVAFCADVSRAMTVKNSRLLVVVGTYLIGKEKVFLAIANALGVKAAVDPNKFGILSCMDDPQLHASLTTDHSSTRLHVLPLFSLSAKNLHAYLSRFRPKYNAVLAFRPTGWTYSARIKSMDEIKPSISGNVCVYGVPYSEHSSFEELGAFVSRLKPSRVVPTVNVGSATSRASMDGFIQQWLEEAAM